MQNRIVEIATDGVHLSLSRGFVKVSKDGAELGRVGLPDIGGLVVRGFGATLSLNLAARLAQENIPVVLCGADQSPACVIWPMAGHHGQGHIIEAQSRLSQSGRKRLWQAIIKAKIRGQAQVLDMEGLAADDLFDMARRVKSGDPDNLEAQAARRYWPRMLGTVEDGFVRNAHASGLNGWLNYGYTVLRAGAARSILAAGLHPSLSIHHASQGEPLRLSSDLMEPFRPFVDLTVRRHAMETGTTDSLDKDSKQAIVSVLSLDLVGPAGASPVQTCLDRLAQSLARYCLGERRSLELPRGLARPREEDGD